MSRMNAYGINIVPPLPWLQTPNHQVLPRREPARAWVTTMRTATTSSGFQLRTRPPVRVPKEEEEGVERKPGSVPSNKSCPGGLEGCGTARHNRLGNVSTSRRGIRLAHVGVQAELSQIGQSGPIEMQTPTPPAAELLIFSNRRI